MDRAADALSSGGGGAGVRIGGAGADDSVGDQQRDGQAPGHANWLLRKRRERVGRGQLHSQRRLAGKRRGILSGAESTGGGSAGVHVLQAVADVQWGQADVCL